MKNFLIGTALLVLAAVIQGQAVVTGTWQGETRNGTPIVLELKASEATLTGTLTRNGEAATITEGRVSKNTITFKAVLGDQAESFTGEVSGDEMKVWLDRQGREAAATFRRVRK